MQDFVPDWRAPYHLRMSDQNPPVLIVSGTNRPGSNALRVAKVLQRHYQQNHARAEILKLVHGRE